VTNTATATRTPTPTATPRIYLSTLCSAEPSKTLSWSITNPGNEAVDLRWQVHLTEQSGEIRVEAMSSSYFTTQTIPKHSNTVVIFRNGMSIDIKSPSWYACATATPTATNTATPTSTSVPDATATNTPEPTATPSYLVSGTLRGIGGEELSRSEKNRLGNMNLLVEVRRKDKKGQTWNIPVQGDEFSWNVSLPEGYYEFSLQSDGRIAVTSKPKTYKIWVLAQQEQLDFAVRLKTTQLSEPDNSNTSRNRRRTRTRTRSR